MWIANAARSREIDRLATEKFGIPARVLMEAAGRATFDAAREMAPEARCFKVLCGRGNNGGDGFVVARLALVAGLNVSCLVAGERSQMTVSATEQLVLAEKSGVVPVFCDDPSWSEKLQCCRKADVLVDALLGTGAKGEVVGPILEAIHAINQSGVPVISVDIPSGILCDTGEELGESVWASRTVTFGLPKPFLFQGIGMEHAGFWTVADIGFPKELLTHSTDAEVIEPELVASLIPERMRSSHKGENGHVLVVAGSDGMPGAAALCARAALRAGAGLVTVASTAAVCSSIAKMLPEALLLPLPDADGFLDHAAESALLERAVRCSSAVFGPGLGHTSTVRELLRSLWGSWSIPSVIDADALNAVSAGVSLPQCPCVLTPHPGEMSRLLHSSVAEIQSDRFRTVRHAVERFEKTCLLKGPYSIIGSPGRPLTVNATGNCGMASGGMGDVLSGVIGTLLGQLLPPHHAAACGAYWHGEAGDIAALEVGPIGFLASEVADRLPGARWRITAKIPCQAERQRQN